MEERKTIILSIQKGIIDVIHNPEQVQIMIRDYDVEEETDTKKDKDGKIYWEYPA